MHAWLVLRRRRVDLTQYSSLNTRRIGHLFIAHIQMSFLFSFLLGLEKMPLSICTIKCTLQRTIFADLSQTKPNQKCIISGCFNTFLEFNYCHMKLGETKNNICSTMIINMTMVTGPVSGVTWAVVSFRTPWLVTQFPPLIVSPARMRTARHHVFLVSWQKLFQVAMIIFMFLSDQHYESCFILDKKSDWRSGWYFSHLSKSWNRQNSGSNSSSCHGRQLWGQHE